MQACKAALSDPDTHTYDQVLSGPDIEEWKKSAHKEITQIESKNTWVEVSTSEATSKILPSTWVQESSHRNHNHVQGKILC